MGRIFGIFYVYVYIIMGSETISLMIWGLKPRSWNHLTIATMRIPLPRHKRETATEWRQAEASPQSWWDDQLWSSRSPPVIRYQFLKKTIRQLHVLPLVNDCHFLDAPQSHQPGSLSLASKGLRPWFQGSWAPVGAYEFIALHALQLATLTRHRAAALRGVQGYAQSKAWPLRQDQWMGFRENL